MSALDSIQPVAQGYKRAWLRCRACGNPTFRDYVPYSLSRPIIALPCGHWSVERDHGCDSISEIEARNIIREREALPV